jgi:hypothetical protein
MALGRDLMYAEFASVGQDNRGGGVVLVAQHQYILAHFYMKFAKKRHAK